MSQPVEDDGPRREPRRALTNVGGVTTVTGDPEEGARLATAAAIPEDADARRLTHGLHTWPARMHPDTAAALIAMAPDGPVLDPFMGGGTVVVEAMLAGRAAFGRDVNPLSLEIAWARTRNWPAERISAWEASALETLRVARSQRGTTRLPDALYKVEKGWFDTPALIELWALRSALASEPDSTLRRLTRLCLSTLIVKASRQVSDSVPKVDRDHRYIPKDRVMRWFEHRIPEMVSQLGALHTALSTPQTAEPELRMIDARDPDVSLEGRIAAVITSPPYPGVYDYVDHQRRRYALLGIDPGLADRREMGRRKTVTDRGWMSASWRFRDDLAKAMSTWRAALTPEGRVWLVIGDGQHRDGVIRVTPLVEGAAKQAGLTVTACVSQPRTVFGMASAVQSERHEHIIGLAVTP